MKVDDLMAALPVILVAAMPQMMSAMGRLYRGNGISGMGPVAGSIRPDPVVAWITIVILGVFTALCFIGVLVGQVVVGVLGGFMTGTLLAFVAPSLGASQVVQWNEAGIEGPCQSFGLTLGTRRVFMRWDELCRAGRTAVGYWYAETRDGRRVYWANTYREWGTLTAALYRRCPELQLPPDMHLPGGPRV